MSANIEDQLASGGGDTGADCLCRCVPCGVGRHGDCRKAGFDWCGDEFELDPDVYVTAYNRILAARYDLEDTEEL